MGLESVELALALEEEFDLQLPIGMVESASAVGQVTEEMCRLLGANGRNVDRNQVRLKVHAIVSELSGTEPANITASTRFREDLDWG